MSKVQATTHVFGPRFSETVLNELDPRYSRATVAMAASEKEIPFGAVLARNADGAYAPLGADGDPRAILIQDLPAGETQALVLRGYAIVNAAGLVFADGVDKKAALTALEDAGFVVRDIPATDWSKEDGEVA